MSSFGFRFRQFFVRHDACAHRVGTDGVLLGAWAKVEGCRRILDIGTGSGLIALMAAQRAPEAEVVGIEIDAQATRQAQENAQDSPFADRVHIIRGDVREFQDEQGFDCILCNPPFFTEDTLSPDASRALARHAALLGYEDLLMAVRRLLNDGGIFHVILPYSSCNNFVNQSFIIGVKVVRYCEIRTVVHRPPKRVLLSLSSVGSITEERETLVLQDASGGRSEAYATLTHGFYL